MHNHLCVIDFDGTIAATFEESPHGMNVNTASDLAVLDVFGKHGFQTYEQMGKLSGREPGELVKKILQSTLRNGNDFPVDELTKKYIDHKLSYLIPEISPQWPMLYPGVKDFFQQVHSGIIPLDIAIVSSGHNEFIDRVFAVNNIKTPDIVVTSDILRLRELPNRHRYKPSPYQLAEAHYQWKKQFSENNDFSDGQHFAYVGRNQRKPNIVYIGDDPHKDGELARRSKIPFLFVPFTQPNFTPQFEKAQYHVTDFYSIRDIFIHHAQELRDGCSFAQIFFGKSDTELFPTREGKLNICHSEISHSAIRR